MYSKNNKKKTPATTTAIKLNLTELGGIRQCEQNYKTANLLFYTDRFNFKLTFCVPRASVNHIDYINKAKSLIKCIYSYKSVT